ncbi:MAG: TauD/TfdA family dioxygenase [Luminiphilus sp.]|nr:TauD/TfdA family dioxygenase [Luminiphilus sp.]
MLRFQPQPVTGQQRHADAVFPLVLAADGPVSQQDFRAESAVLMEQLATYGAILFRDCGVTDAQTFDDFVAGFSLSNFPYDESLSNAVRHNRTPRVFTANEAPQDVEIFLHHEMAQTPYFPSHLFFYCEQAAASGGATPLCRSDVLLEKLTLYLPEFVARCRAHGARYSLNMPAAADATSGQGRSWRQTLNAESKEAAEARLAALHYEWQWLPDDAIRTTTPALSLIRQAPSGKEVFFNQLIAAFCGWQDQRNQSIRSVTYGDGSAFDEADVESAVEIAYEWVFDLPWESGDVALIDNYQVMHGRRPFSGERSVLASLCLNSATT